MCNRTRFQPAIAKRRSLQGFTNHASQRSVSSKAILGSAGSRTDVLPSKSHGVFAPIHPSQAGNIWFGPRANFDTQQTVSLCALHGTNRMMEARAAPLRLAR
ncbi:hypothetical protein LIA77_08955 [Sarocladium implicatum]|nr:hypothetical protein LIA77_08955 [Sarocladium implicatum]